MYWLRILRWRPNQQIETLAGTLDGQGHTITLTGDALAKEVSGTIQNLGVAGTVTVTSGYKGSIAETLTRNHSEFLFNGTA